MVDVEAGAVPPAAGRKGRRAKAAAESGSAKPRAKLRDIWPHIRDHRRVLIVIAVVSLIASGLGLLQPLVLQNLINTVGAGGTVGSLMWVLIALAVLSFGLVAIVQAMFPLWAYHPAAAGLRVHLSNGFYANAVFDRWLGGWSTRRSAQTAGRRA